MSISTFSAKRNHEKSVYTLRGLLSGLVADKQLNATELLFLDIWLKEQSKLPNEGDVLDLIELIQDVLEDNIITADEKKDLMAQIDCILEYGTPASSSDEKCINELIGILKGISCDDQILLSEFEYLDTWLLDHQHLKNTWPFDTLSRRILEIKEDGIVTDTELEHLLETLKKITGTRFTEDGAVSGTVTEVWFDSVDTFEHANKHICFTGNFITGTRKHCEQLAIERGASTSKTVTKNIDVLIIGSTASKDWRFTSHGRKIEKAMKYKSENNEILLISENAWIQHL